MRTADLPLNDEDATTILDERPAITLTVFRKDGGPLTKRLSIDEAGALVSDGSACRMSHGTAQSVSVTSMEEFAQLISGLDQAEAVALGRLWLSPKTVKNC